MANLSALTRFDINRIDFNLLLRFRTSSQFYDNVPVQAATVNLIYEDQFQITWQEPGFVPVRSTIFGTGMRVDNGVLTGGTIQAYSENEFVSGAWRPLSAIEGISVSAIAFEAALRSSSLSDDSFILNEIFSGEDTVGLSNSNDHVRTFAGNDFIRAYGGNDAVEGGLGIDTAAFSGIRAQYVRSGTADIVVISDQVINRDGADTHTGVERFQFADGTLALDTSGNAGQVYRLYQAAFARTPDNAGLKHNIGLVDGGLSLTQMSSAFLASAEFQQKYGANPTDTAYINALYRNVLGRDADAAGLQGWQDRLNDGSWNRTTLLIGFSESPENIASVAPAIANGIFLL